MAILWQQWVGKGDMITNEGLIFNNLYCNTDIPSLIFYLYTKKVIYTVSSVESCIGNYKAK